MGPKSLPTQLPAYYSLGIAAAVMGLDYVIGPNVEFPALFVLPVVYAAWYGGMRWAVPLCVMPLAHVLTLMGWDVRSGLYEAVIAGAVRVVMLIPIAWWISSVAEAQRSLSKEVALLEGLLPICSYCKKIRDDEGEWQVLEKYIQERTTATFTHGVCQSCLKEQLGDSIDLQRRSG